MGTSINAIHRLYLEAIVIIVAIEIIFINKPIILLGQISNEDNPRLLTYYLFTFHLPFPFNEDFLEVRSNSE